MGDNVVEIGLKKTVTEMLDTVREFNPTAVVVVGLTGEDEIFVVSNMDSMETSMAAIILQDVAAKSIGRKL